QMTSGRGFAHFFYRPAKPIAGRGLDEFDAGLARRSDRGNGFRLLGSTPHPAADGPGAERNTRHFKRCADDGGTLHLDFAGFGFTRHGLAPSSPWLRQPFSACSQASSQPRRIDAAYTRVAGLSVGHLASALLLHLGGPRSARS